MSEGISRDEFTASMDRLHEAMRNGFEGVYQRQDRTNGRLNSAEIKIAVLETKAGGTDAAARLTGLGGLLAGIGTAIWHYLGK